MSIFRILAEAAPGASNRATAWVFVSADTLFDAIELLPDGFEARSVAVRVDPQSEIGQVACGRSNPAGPAASLVDASHFRVRRDGMRPKVGGDAAALRKPGGTLLLVQPACANSGANGC